MKRLPASVRVGGWLLFALASQASAAQPETPEPRPEPGPTPLQERVVKQAKPEFNQIKGSKDIRPSAEGPLRISREEAVLLALKNNKLLNIQMLTPVLRGAFEDIERSRFDTNLFAQASLGREKSEFFFPGVGTIPEDLDLNPRVLLPSPFRRNRNQDLVELPQDDNARGSVIDGERSEIKAGASKRFITGTQVEVAVSNERIKSQSDTIERLILEDLQGSAQDAQNKSRVGLTLSQALLKGGSPSANLARIQQAQADTLATQYQLRGFTQTLVAQIESLYWDYYLFKRQLEILEDSVRLSEQQLHEIEERVEVGQIAETQLPAPRAELALRRQALIDARSTFEKLRLRFLQQLNPQSAEGWQRMIEIVDVPTLPAPFTGKVEDHVQLALRHRPDLNEARMQLRSGEFQVVQTRNGLLPALNVFMTLGGSGYAGSFSDSVDNLSEGDYWDAGVGLRLDFPVRNRQSRAIHLQSTTARDQRELALQNLEQLAELDVRSAFMEVKRAEEQVSATAATRSLQEAAQRAERENFLVGKSTATLLSRAQRDLVSSQIEEVRSVVNLRKALIDLYRQDGTLLEYRGITAPGPVPSF
ncbi:MAG: TolC family protein [Candidatus Macondimonas sp.]|jgi:outer membrane protein TolC